MSEESVLYARKTKVEPLCPIFNSCGGCRFQDASYERELAIKEAYLKRVLRRVASFDTSVLDAIVPSPAAYHYRSRLDIGFYRTKRGEYLMGFMPEGGRNIIPMESCAIARKEISDFLPELFEQAVAKLPQHYKTANLVVKTGDDGRVFWGGIGRRSLELQEKDYFWTEIMGKKIFYSLDTFFQANLSILPLLLERIEAIANFDRDTHFIDLYAGVGLFGLSFSDKVAKSTLIEHCINSIKMTKYNAAHRNGGRTDIRHGRVEDELPDVIGTTEYGRKIAMIDPPRRGLSPEVCEFLSGMKEVNTLFYLSCNPKALARDLSVFLDRGWTIERIVPFDFFPKTRHLETLVKLIQGKP
uniref:RNA methyltransferase TrmA family n=1 Tax=uncultured bacterium W4-21b TaxID=1130993 RepID=H9BWN0_9BACT|nr:RNA methyltransferase TrmA family [uncultured bacterium W4-21b]